MTDPTTDCPLCPSPKCGLPCGTTLDVFRAGMLRCCACGTQWLPGEAELARAMRADEAYLASLEAQE
jgi:hypothetical protein